jgi:hypothetical protein
MPFPGSSTSQKAGIDSKLKVQPESLIELGDQGGGKAPDHRADAVD